MTHYLPLFPLNLVAFPGETINLHIFEERYKQLIHECLEQKMTFGIPAYVNNSIGYGTEVSIEQLAKTYEDGTMDVSTLALRVFKVIDYTNPAEGKLYARGSIEYLEDVDDEDYHLRLEMVTLIKALYQTINMVKSVEVAEDISTFDVAHKIGLSLQEEYELLQLPKESERQRFVIQHLKRTIPVLTEVERTKEIIRMNGHFKHLDPLDFK